MSTFNSSNESGVLPQNIKNHVHIHGFSGCGPPPVFVCLASFSQRGPLYICPFFQTLATDHIEHPLTETAAAASAHSAFSFCITKICLEAHTSAVGIVGDFHICEICFVLLHSTVSERIHNDNSC